MVDDVALEIVFLAERLHDELLEVTGKQEQAVLVGEDDHVFGAAAIGGVEPHEREERGGVLADGGVARDDVHRGSAVEQGLDVEALERGGEETDGGEFGRATADPVPKRKDAIFADTEFGGPLRVGGDGDELQHRVLADCI